MGTIYANGINQGDLYDLLDGMITKFNATLAYLDADATYVADTDYASTLAIDTMTARRCTGCGLGQTDVVDIMDDYITKFNLLLAKLDADATVTDVNYASTLVLTDNVNTDYTGHIKSSGMFQGNLVYQLQNIITAANALNDKLDADNGGVTTFNTNCDITDNVDVQSVTSA